MIRQTIFLLALILISFGSRALFPWVQLFGQSLPVAPVLVALAFLSKPSRGMPAALAAGLGIDLAAPVLPGLWTAYFLAAAYLLDKYFSMRQWWGITIWTFFVTIGYPIVGLLVGPGVKISQSWLQIGITALAAAMPVAVVAWSLRKRETVA